MCVKNVMKEHDYFVCVQNNDKQQEEKDVNEINSNNESQNKSRRRKRVDAIKVKGKIDGTKEEEVVRLFLVNCDGLGTHSSG